LLYLALLFEPPVGNFNRRFSFFSRLLKTLGVSLRGAFFATLPQHYLSRGGNLVFIDILRTEIASLAKTAKGFFFSGLFDNK